MPTMLILRGIADAKHPRGLLDDASALAAAAKLGYTGQILDMAGRGNVNSPQVTAAVEAVEDNQDITAIYGFSGGGYNTRHAWNALDEEEQDRVTKVIVLGAPGVTEEMFDGCDDVTIVPDPREGHMAGPRMFLAALNRGEYQ